MQYLVFRAYPRHPPLRLPPFPSPPLHHPPRHGRLFFFGLAGGISDGDGICGVGMLIGSVVYVSEPVQVARQSSVPSGSVAEPKTELVGRIAGMVDCKWAGVASDSPDVPFGKEVRTGFGTDGNHLRHGGQGHITGAGDV